MPALQHRRSLHRPLHRPAASREATRPARSFFPYFGVNREGPAGGDGVHNHANTRAELALYDPGLFALIDAIYAGRTLRND